MSIKQPPFLSNNYPRRAAGLCQREQAICVGKISRRQNDKRSQPQQNFSYNARVLPLILEGGT
jgi:hypothetical protein